MAAGLAAAVSPAGYHRAGRSNSTVGFEKSDGDRRIFAAFQWINRLINQPNPELWESHSRRQVYLTAPSDRSPSAGPALTFTGLIPDLHHYNGRGGRAFPLWRDRDASVPNIPPNLLAYLGQKYQRPVSAEDLVAYIAAVAAHPAFTARFKSDLVQPGLRVPLTANSEVFAAAADLGRTVIWVHTFGERFANPSRGRPPGPPRLLSSVAPRSPAAGALSHDPAAVPDTIDYDETNRRLLIGSGYVEGVSRLALRGFRQASAAAMVQLP